MYVSNFSAKISVILLLFLSLVIAGCQGTKTSPTAKTIIEQQKEEQKKKEKEVSQLLEDIPDWFTTPPNGENVGSSKDLTISELANCVSNNFYPHPQVKISNPPTNRKNNIERYVPSVEIAKSELGLVEWIGLNDSIKKTIKWYD